MEVSTLITNPFTGEQVSIEGPIDEQPEYIRREWYGSICSKKEVERIMNMQNGNDYLLKLGAETIMENPKVWGTFMRLLVKNKSEWSLERYFKAQNYVAFKNALKNEDRLRCEEVAYGYTYSNDPNGLIFQSPFGICSTCSVLLRYFTMFSNLALQDFGERVPGKIAFNGLRIASHLMLNRESFDFEIDPRGIIPSDIKESLLRPYPFQSMFLAGHEYSHYLLGHLDDKCITKKALNKAHFKDETDYRKVYGYNTSQKQEFEADIAALNLPQLKDKFYGAYYFYALMWFASLSIHEAAEDSMFPPNGHQTHPGAIARYQNIIENARRPKYFDKQLFYNDIPAVIDRLRELMINDVSANYDSYELYGSMYLDEPNTEWRGPELINY